MDDTIQLRVRDHGAYHRMTEFQKACYNLGLPYRYLGHKLADMSFLDYSFAGDVPRHMPAQRQKKWAQRTKKHFGRNQEEINGIVAFYSAPTDEAAFRAAGSMFEGAMRGGLSCRAVSATMIANRFVQTPKADLYLVHGLSDLPNPQTAWAVRDFLRERDGSMRLLVMSGDGSRGPWVILNTILRMQVDVLLCLKDTDNRSIGTIESP